LSSPPSARGQRILAELTRYVHAHPRGADTLDGVVSWWLPADLAQIALPSEVEAAMQELIASGLIERHWLPSGQVLYAAVTPPRAR